MLPDRLIDGVGVSRKHGHDNLPVLFIVELTQLDLVRELPSAADPAHPVGVDLIVGNDAFQKAVLQIAVKQRMDL